jgi:hypothetical protein
VQQQDAGFAPTAPASLESKHAADPKAFAPTQPSPLPGASSAAAPAPATGPARGGPTLDQAMQETRRNNRVCPKPQKWLSMYALLAASASSAPLPPPPLTGAVWERTPTAPKRMCFVEHLEWAEAQGCLPAVYEFIKSLAENDWFCAG